MLLVCGGDVTREIVARAERLAAVGVVSSSMTPEQLAHRVAGDARRRRQTSGDELPHAHHGTLRELPIPELLRAIHIDALDGVLLLDHGRKKKAIEFRGGWPVSVRSNLVSECLGTYLVEHGSVTQAQLDESVERMRTGEGLQGEILVAMEVMDEEAVVEALEGHALQKFLEIFCWRDGRFALRRVGARSKRARRSESRATPRS